MAVKRIKLAAAMSRISARSRIAVGLVFLLVSVLWLALAMGIIPNERAAVMDGRAKLCEAIAVNSSVFVERGDSAALQATLGAAVARDPEIRSAAVRAPDGRVLVEVGDHAAQWGRLTGAAAIESYVVVPIFANEQRWGTVEVRFRPVSAAGVLGYLQLPQVRVIAFVASACMGLFLLYLRKMLQHLDPSKVVPSRVRSALDTLAEGLVVMDNDERVVLANQAFASVVGRPADALLGTRASRLPWSMDDGHGRPLALTTEPGRVAAVGPKARSEPHTTREGLPDGAAPAELPWLATIRDGQPRMGVVLRLVDAAGVRRSFTVNCAPVLGDGGRHRGVLASFDDVTRLEQNEIELRRSKDAAESANQAKSEFLARMSHEIRTPMNAILGFADVLRRGFEESEAERREYLDTIHTSGQHLLELINDILDLSKIEAGHLEVERTRCAPHRLLREVVAVLSVRAAQKDLALTVRWDGPVPETIETDPTRLRQAVTNLVGNAIKFTEAGSVSVLARWSGDSAAPMLLVDVTDTGIGMRPETLDRIFQPFAQADTSITRRFGGTGLGLSISKQIAEALGGGITVHSEYGHGTTFTLAVTAGSQDGVRALTAAEVEGATESSGSSATAQSASIQLPPGRVLLVEDGVSNRKLISLVLARAGVTVDTAEDGRAGVERALAGSYDVVLMDMQMPVMDGYTAATLLRSKGYATPIIALTAHAMRGDEEKCRAAGCTGFLTKPIDMDVLVRTVREAMGASGENAGGDRRTEPGSVTPDGPKARLAVSVPRTVEGASGATRQPASAGPAIRSSLPADDADFREIILEFIDRLHAQVGAMQNAWAAGDLNDLANLAHWLKGSGGTAGFGALTEPARQLEQFAKQQRLDEAGAAIRSLQELVERIERPASLPRSLSPVLGGEG